MIKYALKCDDGHGFESWFASAEAYDSLLAAGHVACATCGSLKISKALMAPPVKTARTADAAPDDGDKAAALAKLRAEVEAKATYVGGNFASEARAQHLGDVPDRPSYGEAGPDEAKALIEDGVPVAPLPFIPTRKAN